ncbi:DUF2784 domain-containing protein [Spirilliplanes yamanashiensis]|uniref:DUF2784 domain-containing protein n=1 Tax=Spirilliplanes yamanashiensis TaxID=42233 RepID=A0A8J4DHT8_9ACTN|nr:DUF2784 domain-containing protein [Spirilliplanes yamanashiensis]MDP9819622.1 putative lysophospholipase L1 biosynthesis ABC-type transport system permease subunit [Spirilliplanes yamanashiensis]GIJ01558.1 hypothetical protein Sya03_09100 [Spirilliplanes yamanashiensis]
MGFRVLTVLVVAAHFAFLAYVLLGGFLAYRWPRTVWPHLVAVAWIVLIVVASLDCPLTYLEHWARRQAGEVGPFAGFIDRYVAGVLFPAAFEPVAYGLMLTVVALSWAGLAWRRRSSMERPRPTRR